jgi:alkylhydroperoxidase family enzyme
MQVLKSVNPNEAEGPTKEIFQTVEQRLKRLPNMLLVMANSPAILDAYLKFNQAFEHTKMTPKLRGLITAYVAELNGCDYTLSIAHALGAREGISEDEFEAARRGQSNDILTAVALRFAAKVIQYQAHVPSADVELLIQEGFTEEEVVEIVALISLNLFRTYFNLLAGTDVDIPLIRTNWVPRESHVQ